MIKVKQLPAYSFSVLDQLFWEMLCGKELRLSANSHVSEQLSHLGMYIPAPDKPAAA